MKALGLLMAFAVGLAFCPPVARSQAANPEQWQRARLSADALMSQWLVKPDGNQGWRGMEAWQRFVTVDMLAGYAQQSGDHRYDSVLNHAVRDRAGLDGNDDDLWAVLGAISIYRQSAEADLLAYAENTFGELTRSYWDTTCGGGLWWDHARSYKNAITNELLLYAATELWSVTHQRRYADWAAREWTWFAESTMMNRDFLVNDGLTKDCKNNLAPTYTYNQGVILGGLVGLYSIDHDPDHLKLAGRIAKAAVAHLSSSGILQEAVPSLSQDGQIFKGIFVFHLEKLLAATDDASLRAQLTQWLRNNAAAAWLTRDVTTGNISADWTPNHTPLYSGAAQAQAVALFMTEQHAHNVVHDAPHRPPLERSVLFGIWHVA